MTVYRMNAEDPQALVKAERRIQAMERRFRLLWLAFSPFRWLRSAWATVVDWVAPKHGSGLSSSVGPQGRPPAPPAPLQSARVMSRRAGDHIPWDADYAVELVYRGAGGDTDIVLMREGYLLTLEGRGIHRNSTVGQRAARTIFNYEMAKTQKVGQRCEGDCDTHE